MAKQDTIKSKKEKKSPAIETKNKDQEGTSVESRAEVPPVLMGEKQQQQQTTNRVEEKAPQHHPLPTTTQEEKEYGHQDSQSLDDHLTITIIPGKLYYTAISAHPQSTDKRKYFTVDYDLQYEPYFADFGPLHLGHLVRFCKALNAQMDSLNGGGAPAGSDIVFYSSHNGHQRANAGCLIACYCIAVLGMTPTKTWALFDTVYPPFLPFRDANYGPASFDLSIFDILSGLYKAVKLGWFDYRTFDLETYTKLSEVPHGDMQWIVPGKFIAFSGPVEDHPEKNAERLLKPFKQAGVQLMVRLNDRCYDKRTFTECGIRHLELQFPDGGIPTDSIVSKFIAAAEHTIQNNGAVAVHCRAGLGRTGTMIGLYVMKHYGFGGREFIGWSRLCRPGCILGQQQQYLDTVERRFGGTNDGSAVAGGGGGYTKSNRSSRGVQMNRAAGALPQGKKNGGRVSSTDIPSSLPFDTPVQAWRTRVEAEEDLYCLPAGKTKMHPTTTTTTTTTTTSGLRSTTSAAVLAPGGIRSGTPQLGTSTSVGGVDRRTFKFASSAKLYQEKLAGQRSATASYGVRQRIAPSNGNVGNKATKGLFSTPSHNTGLDPDQQQVVLQQHQQFGMTSGSQPGMSGVVPPKVIAAAAAANPTTATTIGGVNVSSSSTAVSGGGNNSHSVLNATAGMRTTDRRSLSRSNNKTASTGSIRPPTVGRANDVLTDLLPSSLSHVGSLPQYTLGLSGGSGGVAGTRSPTNNPWASGSSNNLSGNSGSSVHWGVAPQGGSGPTQALGTKRGAWGSSGEQDDCSGNTIDNRSGGSSSALLPVMGSSAGATAGAMGDSRHTSSPSYLRSAAVMHSALTPPSIRRSVGVVGSHVH